MADRLCSANRAAADWQYSHLTTLRNGNILNRLALGLCQGARILNFGDYVHAVDDIAKDDVLAVQMGRSVLGCDDEELASIGMRARVLGESQEQVLDGKKNACLLPWTRGQACREGE